MSNPTFQRRDFSGSVRPPVDWAVERYSRSALGGPKQATLKARGEDLDLWSLVNLLRCPVEIPNPEGDAAWWGYVAEVTGVAKNTFTPGAPRVQFGVSIDGMSNQIALAYTLSNAAGEETRATTGWDEAGGNDWASQKEYGIKELLATASASSQAWAEAARDSKLAQFHLPQPTLALQYDAAESEATLICRGWWDTLDWRYAAVPLQLALAYTDLGYVYIGGGTPVGNVTWEKVAQEVQLFSDVNLAAAAIYIKKTGAPTDTLQVNIYSAVDGLPDARLAGGELAASALTTDYAWYTVLLDETILCSPGYLFIELERTGDQDAVNYYGLKLDEQARYTPGYFLAYTDGDWTAPQVGDMPFLLFADEPVETTQQIASLARNYGQFFREVAVETRSGIVIESYRDGDSTALYEALLMLQMGTENQRRLLVDIDPTRRLRIYEEPAPPANPHQLWSSGDIADALGNPLRKSTCPVGMWARWKDIIPASVNTSLFADPSLVFIEENEYDVANDRLNPIARGYQDPFDFAKVKDG